MIEPRRIAKAALFNEKNELLILTRSGTDEIRPGEYDFPGGGVDPGESIGDAMIRELAEEIGITLTPGALSLMYAATDYYDNRSRVRFLYVGRIPASSVIVLSHEHSVDEWMPFSKVMDVYNHPVWVGGLEYLIENKQLEL